MKLNDYKSAFDQIKISEDDKKKTVRKLKQIAAAKKPAEKKTADKSAANKTKAIKRLSLRKRIAIFVPVAVVAAAAIVFCAIFFPIGQSDSGATQISNSQMAMLSSAVDNTFGVNALDMSMEISVSDGKSTIKSQSFLKLIERDNTQIAYVNSITEGQEHLAYETLVFTVGDDIYLSNGWDTTKIGNFHGVTDAYTDIGVDVPALSQLDLKLWQMDTNVFKVDVKNQDLSGIVKELEGLVEDIGMGDLTMTIKLNPDTGFMLQADYTIDYKVDGVKLKMTATIKILAINDYVTYDIPKLGLGNFSENIMLYVQDGEIIGLTGYGQSLTQIEIPQAVNGKTITAIRKNAFYYNTRLKTIVVPKNVTSIGRNAFFGCTDLLVISKSPVPPYTDDSFGWGQYRVRAIIVPIEGLAEYKVELQRHVYMEYELPICTADDIDGDFIISDGTLLAYLGDEKDIIVPDGITKIGSYVFLNRDITSVDLPEGLTKIGIGAFDGCTGLKELVMPQSIQQISGFPSFADCNMLIYFSGNVPPAIDILQWGAFAVVAEEDFETYKKAWDDVMVITRSHIIDNTFVIVNNVLAMYLGDSTVLIVPEGVVGISAFGFRPSPNVAAITHLEFPKSMTEFNRDYMVSFHYLPNLKSIKIPSTMKKIDRFMFYNYFGALYFESEVPPFIGDGPFEGATQIIVPKSAVETYKKKWSLYADNIFSDEEIINNDFLVVDGCLIRYLGNDKNIEIPEGITSIGDNAFNKTVDLQSVRVPSTVTYIGRWDFYYSKNYNVVVYLDCPPLEDKAYVWWDTGVKAFVVPDEYLSAYRDGYERWQIRAFASSSVAGDFIIEDGVLMSYIGTDSSVKIPDGVTGIDSAAFDRGFADPFITELFIPASVTSVDVFTQDLKGATLFFEGTQPPSFGNTGYWGIDYSGIEYSIKEIRVPHSAVRAYKLAWPLYAPIIYRY